MCVFCFCWLQKKLPNPRISQKPKMLCRYFFCGTLQPVLVEEALSHSNFCSDRTRTRNENEQLDWKEKNKVWIRRCVFVSHGRNKKEAVTHTGKKCFHPFVHTDVKYTLYAIFFFHSLFCCVSVVHRIHDVYAIFAQVVKGMTKKCQESRRKKNTAARYLSRFACGRVQRAEEPTS